MHDDNAADDDENDDDGDVPLVRDRRRSDKRASESDYDANDSRSRNRSQIEVTVIEHCRYERDETDNKGDFLVWRRKDSVRYSKYPSGRWHFMKLEE
jgi:hypothetical protein